MVAPHLLSASQSSPSPFSQLLPLVTPVLLSTLPNTETLQLSPSQASSVLPSLSGSRPLRPPLRRSHHRPCSHGHSPQAGKSPPLNRWISPSASPLPGQVSGRGVGVARQQPPQLKPPAPCAQPGAGAAAGTSSHKLQRCGADNQTTLFAPQGASTLVPRCLTFRGSKIGCKYNLKQGDEGFVNAKLLRDFSHLPSSLPLTTALASSSSLSFLLLRTAHPPAPFQQQPSHFQRDWLYSH